MKVLLVDDHPLILASLQSIIQTLDEAVAVVTADNAEDAFSLLATDTEVDLVLLDLGLGIGVDGFAVLADLRERYPALPVVVVSATEQLTDMVRAVDMGAMGFVPKRTPNPELFEALALVLSGGVFIPPALLGLVRLPGMSMADAAVAADAATARRAYGVGAVPPAWRTASAVPAAPSAFQAEAGDALAAPPPPAFASPPAALQASPLAGRGALPRSGAAALGITPRQADVLDLLLKGLPNKLIARELNVSVDTIKDHVAAVLRALGVNSRTQAVLVVSRMTQQAAGLSG